MSMVAMLEGDQAAAARCCSSSPKLMSKEALFWPVSLAPSSSGTRRGDGPRFARFLLFMTRLQGVGDDPGCVVLCQLGSGGPLTACNYKISAGCLKQVMPSLSSSSVFTVQRPSSCRSLHTGVVPLFCAWLVDLYGIGNIEDCAFHREDKNILLTVQASSQNFHISTSKFALKMIAVLDVEQQTVATTLRHVLILCCVAIVVVERSLDSVCSKIAGGAMEANILYYHMASIQISGTTKQPIEQDIPKSSSRTSCIFLLLSDDRHVEDAVSKLFGLCHRRWMTTPPLLILRFNMSLSSVKAIQDLQLNSTPRVHISDRPLGEPPTGHQLDITSIEALEDCRCGNYGSELSTDGRTPHGSICNLQHLLHEFRSTLCCTVQLGTFPCSTAESFVVMYFDP